MNLAQAMMMMYGKAFHGHGHNPHPVEIEGVCCDECNAKVVMKRIKQLESEVNNG